METHLNAGRGQHKVPKESTSTVEILAVLILGGIGMVATLLGIYLDNPVLYTIGLVIIIGSALSTIVNLGKSIIEFLSVYQDFKNRRKKRDK